MADLTVKEAGAKGGKSTVAKYSKEELFERRKKGGEITKFRYGMDHFAELGKKSAELRKQRKTEAKTGVLTTER